MEVKKMQTPSMKFNKVGFRNYIIMFLMIGVASFFLVDKFIADFIQNTEWLVSYRQSFGLYIFDELGRAKNWGSGAGLALIISSFFLYLKKGKRYRQQWVRYSGRIFLSVFFTTLLVNIIKTVVGRYRPYSTAQDSEITFYSFQLFQGAYNKLASFPSNHAATAMAVAMTLYYLNPKSKYKTPAFILVAMVMVQRIITSNHYVSDVVVGAGIGLLMAYLATWFWKNFIKIGE